MKTVFSILCFSVLLFSCTAKRSVITPPVDTHKPVNNSDFFMKISEKSNFDQIKINSKVNIQTDSFVPTLDATIYIENGNKVWMNMTAVLFNIARGIATQEGIRGYEKWNKTYIDSDFTYLNNLLNVNFIDYSALQNLLLGKTFIPVNSKDYTLTENVQGYTLTSKKNQLIESNGRTSEYAVTLNYAPNADLKSINLNEVRENNNLEITYSNWISENNLRLPKNVKIIIKSSKNSQILIENTTFAFIAMETPYTVPSNYKKTDIK